MLQFGLNDRIIRVDNNGSFIRRNSAWSFTHRFEAASPGSQQFSIGKIRILHRKPVCLLGLIEPA